VVSAPKRGRGRPISLELTERRRDEIITTAARLFAERGYHTTTLDDIARALGSTKGLIYHYFRSKVELIQQVRRSGIAPVLARLEATAASALPPEHKLRAAIEDYVTVVLFGFERYLVIISDRADTNADIGVIHERELQEMRRRFMHLFRHIIDEGIEAGVFEPVDPSIAAITLIQAIRGIAHWHRPDGRFSPERVRQEVCSLLMRSVLRPPLTRDALRPNRGGHQRTAAARRPTQRS
jgi:AcrR family transcriptional regulator